MAYPNYAYPGASPFLSTAIRSTIPFIIAPTGTMGNNGALTSGTALPTTYPQAYVFLPAGAIVTNSLAGWYYTQFTSTTVGTVFNNIYQSGVPVVPQAASGANLVGAAVPFVTTGPGAYTGVTSAVTGPNINLPSNSLGVNTSMRVTTVFSVPNNANNKVLNSGFGATTNLLNSTQTTITGFVQSSLVCNEGALNKQLLVTNANGSQTVNRLAIDTTQDQTLQAGGQLATATDFIVIEAFIVEIVA